jgi:hypothetical protein
MAQLPGVHHFPTRSLSVLKEAVVAGANDDVLGGTIAALLT